MHMTQHSFVLPNQLRYDKASPSDLCQELKMEFAVVMPSTGPSCFDPMTIGFYILNCFCQIQ